MEERFPAGMPLEQRIPVGAQLPLDHAHEWVEAYRYLPWDDAPLDTAEPPKNEAGEPLKLHDGKSDFDPERHYRVGQPGPEIVDRCTVCSETRIRPVKLASYRTFLKRLADGELDEENVSLLPLDQLLGTDWEKTA